MHSVPRTIQHQTQTYEQLGISNSRLLIRGLFVRCPACGAGRTHKSWTKMNQRCHRCSLRFERIIGHDFGPIPEPGEDHEEPAFAMAGAPAAYDDEPPF